MSPPRVTSSLGPGRSPAVPGVPGANRPLRVTCRRRPIPLIGQRRGPWRGWGPGGNISVPDRRGLWPGCFIRDGRTGRAPAAVSRWPHQGAAASGCTRPSFWERTPQSHPPRPLETCREGAGAQDTGGPRCDFRKHQNRAPRGSLSLQSHRLGTGRISPPLGETTANETKIE